MNWIGWIIQWLSPELISAFKQIDPYISNRLSLGCWSLTQRLNKPHHNSWTSWVNYSMTHSRMNQCSWMNRLREWIDDSVGKTNSCLIEQISWINDSMTVWQYDTYWQFGMCKHRQAELYKQLKGQHQDSFLKSENLFCGRLAHCIMVIVKCRLEQYVFQSVFLCIAWLFFSLVEKNNK